MALLCCRFLLYVSCFILDKPILFVILNWQMQFCFQNYISKLHATQISVAEKDVAGNTWQMVKPCTILFKFTTFERIVLTFS